MADPEFAAEAKRLGYSNPNKEHEVRAIRESLYKQEAARERNDETFRKAEKQLYKEGILTKDVDMSSLSKADKRAYKQAQKEATGSKKGWKNQTNTNSESDLQRIYQRQAEIQGDRENKEYQKQLKKQYDQQQADQKAMADENRKLMEEMMNQPIYSAKQAALPTVQYKAPDPEPMPVAPAPPPAMAINPTPAPQLTNIGNQMSIVKQNATSRARAARRTRGTSSLRN